MKSKEDLELMILKHMVTYPAAMDRALSMGITAEHFCHIEPMQKMCYPRQLYKLCLSYFEESKGSILTYNVLTNKLQKSQIEDHHKSKLELVWQKMQDFDCDENDLYDLLVQIKQNFALDTYGQMIKTGYELMTSQGIEDAIEHISEKVDRIRMELQLVVIDEESVDMSDGADWFMKEYVKRRDEYDQYRGIHFGLKQIDEKTSGVYPGQINVLLAPSSGGKSVQLLNIASYAHLHENKNVLYFSFEMDSWLCYLRHISLITKIPFSIIKGITCDDEQMRTIIDKITEIRGGNYFRYEVSMEDPTPEFVEMKIREITAKKGKPDLVVIDYIGNMTTRNSSRNAKPWEKQGDAFEKLFAMTKRLKFSCLTAQQVNREAIRENRKNKEDGKKAGYWQDSTSGDQRLMHLAYYVIGLEPDKDQNIVTYHPIKMRDCQFEPFSAQIDPANNCIYELTEEKQQELRKVQNPAGDTKDVKVAPSNNGETRVDWGTGTNIVSDDDMEISATDDWVIEDGD